MYRWVPQTTNAPLKCISTLIYAQIHKQSSLQWPNSQYEEACQAPQEQSMEPKKGEKTDDMSKNVFEHEGES